MPDTPAPIPSDNNSEGSRDEPSCPCWCAGDHEDAPALHCSEAVLVPGIALVPRSCPNADGASTGQSRPLAAGVNIGNLGAGDGCIGLSGGDCAMGVTLSVVLHQRGNCPVAWVYIGDGSPQGLEISAETAWLLVRGLQRVLGCTLPVRPATSVRQM